MTTADLAWAAGLFDGEGSVSICLLGGSARQRPLHSLSCVVALAHEGSVLRFSEWFGGDIRKETLRAAHYRQQWRWRTQGNAACCFLETVRPFLFVKAPQADLGIEFFRTKRRYHWLPKAELERRESFRQRMWALNGRPHKKRRAFIDIAKQVEPRQTCKEGHPLAGDNLYVRPRDNARICLECQRAYGRARYRESRRLAAEARELAHQEAMGTA